MLTHTHMWYVNIHEQRKQCQLISTRRRTGTGGALRLCTHGVYTRPFAKSPHAQPLHTHMRQKPGSCTHTQHSTMLFAHARAPPAPMLCTHASHTRPLHPRAHPCTHTLHKCITRSASPPARDAPGSAQNAAGPCQSTPTVCAPPR
eukprot:364493-Chlamydomonas_euryale.AAC.14